MKKQYLSLLLLFLLLLNSVTAVLMHPSVDYVAGDYTLNSRSSIDVDYINISNDPAWINLGSYGNITFLNNFSVDETLVEVGKGWTGGNAIYTTTLGMDVYAPADWIVSIFLNFNQLYIYNLTTGWNMDMLFEKYLFDSDTTLINDNRVETFLQRAGVWPNVDFVFRHNGGWESWWIADPNNEVETIDNTIDHPEYDEYAFHTIADCTLRLIKPHANAYATTYTQLNATHRHYTYIFNPANTLDIDTTNYTNMTVTVTVTAYNESLIYTGSHTYWNVTSIHEVGKPYGSDIVFAEYNVTWGSINMTWNPGNNSDTTVVVRNNNTWPTNPTDGWVVQNNTDVWYNESGVNDTRYYCLFGYNDTTLSYSPRTLVYWGAVQLWNCYNESNPPQAINYSIEITNEDASDSYVALNIGNNHVIDLLDIPYGDNTIFTVTNTSYRTRTYYYDLEVCHFYNYSFYLPPIHVPGGGGGSGENVTHQYRVRVVDDYTYPVAGAKVTVKRYINTTGEYTTVGIIITNGYGEADIELIPGAHYKVWIEKEGYLQELPIPDWFPDPIFYGANYPRVFQIKIDYDATVWTHFWDVASYNGTKYDNNTMRIMFEDFNGGLVNAQFYTYELFNNTAVLNATNTTVISPVTFWLTGINISRSHRIVCHMNHTALVTGYEFVSIIVPPLRTPIYNKNNINNIINLIMGPAPLGNWVDWLFVFLPAICLLVLFAYKKHNEIGIALSCLYIGFTSLFVSVPDQLIILAPIGLVIAGLYAYATHGEAKL